MRNAAVIASLYFSAMQFITFSVPLPTQEDLDCGEWYMKGIRNRFRGWETVALNMSRYIVNASAIGKYTHHNNQPVNQSSHIPR